MSSKWQGEPVPVYVGDRVGNPKTLYVGVVTVGRRTTVGIRTTSEGGPDYTLDAAAVADLASALNGQLRELIKREPFGGAE